MLTRVAGDAERALRAVEGADGLLGEEAVGDAHALLRELVGQDFDVDEDGIPRLHRGTRQDRVLSVHDTEMRHGRKSRHQRFDGYKLHAAAANMAEPLITAVEVRPANEQDGPKAAALVDCQPEERRPVWLLGDTAYGTGPVRAELASCEVEVLAPVPEAPVPRGEARQARLPDRPRGGHRHRPGRTGGEDHTQPAGARLPSSPARLVATAPCGRAASAPAPPTRSSGSPPTRTS
jgi:Transposase DDE domain